MRVKMVAWPREWVMCGEARCCMWSDNGHGLLEPNISPTSIYSGLKIKGNFQRAVIAARRKNRPGISGVARKVEVETPCLKEVLSMPRRQVKSRRELSHHASSPTWLLMNVHVECRGVRMQCGESPDAGTRGGLRTAESLIVCTVSPSIYEKPLHQENACSPNVQALQVEFERRSAAIIRTVTSCTQLVVTDRPIRQQSAGNDFDSLRTWDSHDVVGKSRDELARAACN